MKKLLFFFALTLCSGLLLSVDAQPRENPVGNLIKNGGFENSSLDAWDCGPTASWETRRTRHKFSRPYSGDSYVQYAGPAISAELCQTVPMPEKVWTAVDAEALIFDFHVAVQSFGKIIKQPPTGNPPTMSAGGGRILVEYLDDNDAVLDSYDSGSIQGYFYSWLVFRDTRIAPAGTRSIRIRLRSGSSYYRGSSSASFDEAFLCVRALNGKFPVISSSDIAEAFLVNYNNPWKAPKRPRNPR